ncbi:hypothetical protein GCM10009096_20690 [Parasphingorhabdus litoris]|uniref:Transposase n=1 Tax=Parasphingorhabdus litoris TaxID=394733 RepID=A0ABN1AKB9_9SPHN
MHIFVQKVASRGKNVTLKIAQICGSQVSIITICGIIDAIDTPSDVLSQVGRQKKGAGKPAPIMLTKCPLNH